MAGAGPIELDYGPVREVLRCPHRLAGFTEIGEAITGFRSLDPRIARPLDPPFEVKARVREVDVVHAFEGCWLSRSRCLFSQDFLAQHASKKSGPQYSSSLFPYALQARTLPDLE